MDNDDKPPRRPVHRYAGYKWHPRGDLYGRLSAFAEANGVLRSEALNMLVADALDARQAGQVMVAEDVAVLLDQAQAVLTAVHRMEVQTQELALRLDLLGAVALTVVHAVAYATALDPESREIGESREDAEERVLASVFEASQNAWQILRPTRPEDQAPHLDDASAPPSNDRPRQETRALLDHWTTLLGPAPEARRAEPELTPWRRRQVIAWAKAYTIDPAAVLALLSSIVPRGTGSGPGAALTPSNRERIAMWARVHDVRPDVAVNALVDLALCHVDTAAGLPPWSALGLKGDIESVRTCLFRCGNETSTQQHVLDAIGACLAGVPYVVAKWCAAADDDFDHDFSDGEEPAAGSEGELRQAFAKRSEDLWHGMVAGLLEEPHGAES
jgi:hypothetical protein